MHEMYKTYRCHELVALYRGNCIGFVELAPLSRSNSSSKALFLFARWARHSHSSFSLNVLARKLTQTSVFSSSEILPDLVRIFNSIGNFLNFIVFCVFSYIFVIHAGVADCIACTYKHIRCTCRVFHHTIYSC